MAKFLSGDELNAEIGKIFENAKDRLILISPYIKLHHRYEAELKSKISNDKLEIIIVFGKNQHDLSKSLSLEDFNFFKQFPRIEIRYEKRLHAKFYANEHTQILTSMNLYNYSQNENIEAGVKTEFNALGNIASKLIIGEKTLDQDAWDHFNKIIDNSEILFKNEPVYESQMLGLTKKFKSINTITDKISAPSSRSSHSKNETGYCIRTGEKIPFDTQKPFSSKAFESWMKFKNEDYPEKYCHKTGRASYGKTSMKNPVLG